MGVTAQEIFDTVLTHLRKQGKAAKSIYGKCLYRGVGGTSCAVGCLIPDAMYDLRIEGLEVRHIMYGRFPGGRKSGAAELLPIVHRIAAHLGAEHVELLEELQSAHDWALGPQGPLAWEDSMRRVAGKFNLKYTPPAGVFEADQ